MRQQQLRQKVFDAATANRVGKTLLVADFKKIVAIITVTTPFTTGTLKFMGAISAVSDPLPNFAVAASKTNQIAYLPLIKNIDRSAVAGDTGIDLAVGGTQIVEIVGGDALSYLTGELSAITGAGEVTVTVSAYGDSV